jgi:acetylornithine/N-succinyldiaminopimelate aminotransferase
VQCGYFRTGRWQSYQRILEAFPAAENFAPDAIAMAKSLGAGYPIGAVWIREPYQNVFGPGSHGTTYGGSPLACAVALTVLDVVEREKLADNIRARGEELKRGLRRSSARGASRKCGATADSSAWCRAENRPPSSRGWTKAGLILIPAANNTVRFCRRST